MNSNHGFGGFGEVKRGLTLVILFGVWAGFVCILGLGGKWAWVVFRIGFSLDLVIIRVRLVLFLHKDHFCNLSKVKG